MKITTKIFEQSFYNIGAGFDIEPLHRFTHLTNTFIYVNLGLKKDKVIEWYDYALRFSEDIEIIEKTVIDNFDELNYFEMHKNYLSHLTKPDFISTSDLRDYHNTFNWEHKNKHFAIHYKLRRISLNREIDFYYISSEGLASYIALSHNGIYAPKILCTIQTGVLENPEGIMNKMLIQKNYKTPSIWIRGFEPEYYSRNSNRNKALKEKGLFNIKVLDFNRKWICGMSYPAQRSFNRYCKAFTTTLQLENLKKHIFNKKFINDKDKIISGSILDHIKDFNKYDWLIISKNIYTKLEMKHPNTIFWEDIIPKRSFWRYTHRDASKQINKLKEQLKQNNINNDVALHIIPFCNEDEGALYMKSIKELKNKTYTYLNNMYDFIDLKI